MTLSEYLDLDLSTALPTLDGKTSKSELREIWSSFGVEIGEETDGQFRLTAKDCLCVKLIAAAYNDHHDHLKWESARHKKQLKVLERALKTPTTDPDNMTINMPEPEPPPAPSHVGGLAETVASEALKRPKAFDDLVAKTREARDALFESMKDLGSTVANFKTETDAYCKEVRMFRASVVSDISAARHEMEDIRKFFLSKDHDAEMQRLSHFIDLCERLQKLKKDGTLDAVAETILKLEGA